jgi:deoxyribose-phosphate aldolase
MDNSIQSLQDAIHAKMEALKVIHGTGQLSTSAKDLVSAQADSINETWNNDLPPRPH